MKVEGTLVNGKEIPGLRVDGEKDGETFVEADGPSLSGTGKYSSHASYLSQTSMQRYARRRVLYRHIQGIVI